MCIAGISDLVNKHIRQSRRNIEIMDVKSSETELPDDQPSLEVIKLKEEIREVREKILQSRYERSWSFPKTVQLAMAILVGVSPIIFTALNYRQEIRKYVDTMEQAETFKVSTEVIKLFEKLSSKEPDEERVAALSLTSYGRAALPFLTEHLNIDHNYEVYKTIVRSLRLIVNRAVDKKTGESYIKFIWEELRPAAEANLELFLGGELGEPDMFKAQLRAIGSMAVATKYSETYRKDILDLLQIFKEKILSMTTYQENEKAKQLIEIIHSYLRL